MIIIDYLIILIVSLYIFIYIQSHLSLNEVKYGIPIFNIKI